MKITIVIFSILSLITIAQVYMSKLTSRAEQHKYEVLKKYDQFEVRKYEPALFSSVVLEQKAIRKVQVKVLEYWLVIFLETMTPIKKFP